VSDERPPDEGLEPEMEPAPDNVVPFEKPKRKPASSAATKAVRLARETFAFVTDTTTNARYFKRKGQPELRPQHWGGLGDALATVFFDVHDAALSSAQKKEALAVLNGDPAPPEQVIEPPKEGPTEEEREAEIRELAAASAELRAHEGSLLDELDEALRTVGYAGETKAPRLVYLNLLTALLEIGPHGLSDRMGSVKVDGPTAAGKNFTIEHALEFVPDYLVIKLTAASEKALLLDQTPIAHRFLYFPEGAGINDESMAAVALRSLLSEGELHYLVGVSSDFGVPTAEWIHRDGPTGALIATSLVQLDRDMETRLMQIGIDDSPAQTRAVIDAHGVRAQRGGLRTYDYTPWQELFRWAELQGPYLVRVPFARALSSLIPETAIRLRRDVQQLFLLIAAHAVLHLDHRERGEGDVVVATAVDYEAVRGLIDASLGTMAGLLVPDWAEETYNALPVTENGITFAGLGKALGIGRDAARDRARKLVELGYAANRDSRPGAPAKLVRGEEPPRGNTFLPGLDMLDRVVAEYMHSRDDADPDPTARHAAQNGMGIGVERRVPQSDVGQTSEADDECRPDVGLGDPTSKPLEQAKSGAMSGVRGGSGPDAREHRDEPDDLLEDEPI